MKQTNFYIAGKEGSLEANKTKLLCHSDWEEQREAEERANVGTGGCGRGSKQEQGAGRDPLTVCRNIRVKGLRKFLKKKKLAQL